MAARVPAGGGCVVAAFPDADAAALAAAARAITTATGSTVGTALTDALDPRHWQQSRSAIGGLRRLGVGALAGAPALAGWVRLCAPAAVSAEEQYTVNEALLALAELRRLAGEAAVVPPAAVGTVTGFLDTTFEPALTGLLVPPLRIWHRGALGYLRGLHGDLERLLSVLHGFLAALDDPPAGDPDAAWHEYTRMELVAAIADLGPRLDRLRLERSWQAPQPGAGPDTQPERPAEPAAERAADQAAKPAAKPAAESGPESRLEPDGAVVRATPADLTAWLISELAVPSIARRRSACTALAALGPRAAAALPAVLQLLAELDAAPERVVGELRNQALAAAVALSADW